MTIKQAFDGAEGLNKRRYELMNLVSRSRNRRLGKSNPAVAGEWAQTGSGYRIKVRGLFDDWSAPVDVAVHRKDGQIGHLRGCLACGETEDGFTLFSPPARETKAQREAREDAEREDELDELAEEAEDEWDWWAVERRRKARGIR